MACASNRTPFLNLSQGVPRFFELSFPIQRNLTEIHVHGWTGLLSPSTLNLLKAAFITMFYCMLQLWSLHLKVSVDLAGHSCSSNWKDSKWTKSQEIKSNFCFRWVGRADLPREELLWGQHKTNKLNVHTASRPKSPLASLHNRLRYDATRETFSLLSRVSRVSLKL